MSRNNIMIIVVAIILIIVCIIAGSNNKNNDTGIGSKTLEENKQVAFNTVTNEVTNQKEYIVYDKETGEEITRVEEEYQLKIYELDPDFEGLSEDASYEEMQEESIIE